MNLMTGLAIVCSMLFFANMILGILSQNWSAAIG